MAGRRKVAEEKDLFGALGEEAAAMVERSKAKAAAKKAKKNAGGASGAGTEKEPAKVPARRGRKAKAPASEQGAGTSSPAPLPRDGGDGEKLAGRASPGARQAEPAPEVRAAPAVDEAAEDARRRVEQYGGFCGYVIKKKDDYIQAVTYMNGKAQAMWTRDLGKAKIWPEIGEARSARVMFGGVIRAVRRNEHGALGRIWGWSEGSGDA